MNTFAKLIDKYRKNNDLSFRGFAAEINTYLPDNFGLSYSHWHSIYRGAYLPDYYSAWYLAYAASGWVRDFAKEMVKALEGADE